MVAQTFGIEILPFQARKDTIDPYYRQCPVILELPSAPWMPALLVDGATKVFGVVLFRPLAQRPNCGRLINRLDAK